MQKKVRATYDIDLSWDSECIQIVARARFAQSLCWPEWDGRLKTQYRTRYPSKERETLQMKAA
jgi:hypothetical protein